MDKNYIFSNHMFQLTAAFLLISQKGKQLFPYLSVPDLLDGSLKCAQYTLPLIGPQTFG